MSRYGLIGEKLSHSFSKIIHEKLCDYSYDLLPMNKNELHGFMMKKQFDGINVTIPYKLDVIPYCDEIDDTARRIGSVNTIVNKNGKLIGYNTDFYGFLYTIKVNNINVVDKIVMILGSGGTCKTVNAVAKYLQAKEIIIVSRTQSEHSITYEQALKRQDVDVIVNASPKGMYPNNDECGLDISNFKSLSAVIDVIYNPLKTRLLQQAQANNIQYVNGLQMLVAQAKYAAEFFTGEKIADIKIKEIYKELMLYLSNIVLVGMPSSGKTTIGQEVSILLNKKFVDTDEIIEKENNMTIPQIFEECGEKEFRQLEQNAISNISKQTNLVIATGGGAILDEKNILNLQQNGVVVFIDRALDDLLIGQNRPLSKSKSDIEKLYKIRHTIYLSCSDITVCNTGNIQDAVNILIEKYHDFVNQ